MNDIVYIDCHCTGQVLDHRMTRHKLTIDPTRHRVDAKCMECGRPKDHPPDALRFHVSGAGFIELSASAGNRCGGADGFSLAASWGSQGLAGGVIDAAEAVRLARHILAICEPTTDGRPK